MTKKHTTEHVVAEVVTTQQGFDLTVNIKAEGATREELRKLRDWVNEVIGNVLYTCESTGQGPIN